MSLDAGVRNRVAESGIISVQLKKFIPSPADWMELPISAFTQGEPIIREKVFREALKKFEFQNFKDKIAVLHNDLDTLVQSWVWMLLASRLQGVAENVFIKPVRSEDEADIVFDRFCRAFPPEKIQGKSLIIAGCGNLASAARLYSRITWYVMPWVKNLMYGEACSAVPIFKTSAFRPLAT
ncbi:MAG: DUF2480 family protein [Flavobacteriales bacterium]|nr:DUF2480 family protein [Flavobacteriales bacterium]MDW8431550.1 DUF2480 family protein [Flavobacteriales bacterium]